jgi:hypothetical protein|tara:strand:+ start:5342 stop:5722 length:381 start_codon:yes stop_codon:yes gene_type:complete
LEILTEDNFLIFAAQHYDNPQCSSTEEFYDDLNKFKYIKRLFNKYNDTGELRERLILNHIVVLINVFSPPIAVKLLFLRLEGHLHLLKPFLVLLNVLPEVVIINTSNILTVDIPMDHKIVEALRNI